MFYAVLKHLFPSVNLGHGGRSGIFRQILLRFQQMRVFWDARDLLLRIHEATTGRQLSLAAEMRTSLAASTCVSKLDAAQE